MSVLQTFDPPAGYILNREVRYVFTGNSTPLDTDIWQPPSWSSGNTIALGGQSMTGFGYLENVEYDWLPNQRIQVFTNQSSNNGFGIFVRSHYGFCGNHEAIAFLKWVTSGDYFPYEDIGDAPSPYLFGCDLGYGWEADDYPAIEIFGSEIRYAHWSSDGAHYIGDQEIKAPHSLYGSGIDGYGGLMRLCPYSGSNTLADDHWIDAEHSTGRPGFYFNQRGNAGTLVEILISDFAPDPSIPQLTGQGIDSSLGSLRPSAAIALR